MIGLVPEMFQDDHQSWWWHHDRSGPDVLPKARSVDHSEPWVGGVTQPRPLVRASVLCHCVSLRPYLHKSHKNFVEFSGLKSKYILPWSILSGSCLPDNCAASQQEHWRGWTSRPLCCPAPRSWQWQCVVRIWRLMRTWQSSPWICIVCSWAPGNRTQRPAQEICHKTDPLLHYQVLRKCQYYCWTFIQN